MSKYTALAKTVPNCMGCRKPNDGTIVACHRNRNAWGLRAGRGIKTIELLTAFMCSECHRYGDTDGCNDYNWWELAVHRTITWSLENGHIKV
jgi:hypothetical protein